MLIRLRASLPKATNTTTITPRMFFPMPSQRLWCEGKTRALSKKVSLRSAKSSPVRAYQDWRGASVRPIRFAWNILSLQFSLKSNGLSGRNSISQRVTYRRSVDALSRSLCAEPITGTTIALATSRPGGANRLLIPSGRRGRFGFRRGGSNEGRQKSASSSVANVIGIFTDESD